MARTSISRTVVKTICNVIYIDSENERKETEISFYGDYDMEHANPVVMRLLKAKGAIITDIRHESFYGTMSLEKFAKYCEHTNEKDW